MELKLSLIENSFSYLKEAVQNLDKTEEDPIKWKFAIINVSQAVELCLKQILYKEHPILIYKNIDDRTNTVSAKKALERLCNNECLSVDLAPFRKRISKVIDIRNELVHYQLTHKKKFLAIKFVETVGVLYQLYSRYLKISIQEAVGPRLYNILREHEKTGNEIIKQAKKRLKDEKVDEDNIWICPNCYEETFNSLDEKGVCYVCDHYDELAFCDHCREIVFRSEITDFSIHFETDYADCETTILNDYGYNYSLCCLKCLPKIEEDIEEKIEREKQEFYYEEYFS